VSACLAEDELVSLDGYAAEEEEECMPGCEQTHHALLSHLRTRAADAARSVSQSRL
jgi:hypothetical protein